MADTLHELAVVLSEAEGRRTEDAEGYFRRVVKIYEATLGPDDPQTGQALHELGVCVGAGYRKEESVRILTRALRIREVALEAEGMDLASTLHELGLAAWEIGRDDEAAELLARALRIQEVNLGPNDLQVRHEGTGA